MGGNVVRAAARLLVASGVVLGALALPAAVRASTPAMPASSPFAVVRADATLASGNEVVSTAHVSTGFYEVLFDTSVAGCAYVASLGDPADGLLQEPGSVSTAQRAGKPNGVFVATFDSGGGSADRPFHLQVQCGQKPWAVVDATGLTVRGALGGIALHVGIGSYEVVFDKNTKKCEYSAAIGNPGIGTPPAGRIVTAMGTPAKSTVLVQTQTPAGTPADLPFHLIVTCANNPLSAVVASDGTLDRGSAVRSVQLAPGGYEVRFAQPVDGCAFVATIGGVDQDPETSAFVWTAERAGLDTAVLVQPTDALGRPLARAFHLSVYC